MTRSAALYVADILAEMDRAEAFVAGLPLEAFIVDDKTVYAVIRALEIMGEAAKHVPTDVRARFPEVSWRAMAGMRDRLAHSYWKTDLSYAWQAVHDRFPAERPALQRLLAELDAEAGG